MSLSFRITTRTRSISLLLGTARSSSATFGGKATLNCWAPALVTSRVWIFLAMRTLPTGEPSAKVPGDIMFTPLRLIVSLPPTRSRRPEPFVAASRIGATLSSKTRSSPTSVGSWLKNGIMSRSSPADGVLTAFAFEAAVAGALADCADTALSDISRADNGPATRLRLNPTSPMTTALERRFTKANQSAARHADVATVKRRARVGRRFLMLVHVQDSVKFVPGRVVSRRPCRDQPSSGAGPASRIWNQTPA